MSTTETTTCHLTESLAIASLVMRLGEVERATRHPDGRHETDTTHTVMLALTAWRMAGDVNATLPPSEQLHLESVLILALIHDMPEAIAGDVVTLRPLDADARQAKADAEAAAVECIRDELPWLAGLIDVHEEQQVPEARYVHFLDKLMPKLTHIHDGCRVLRERGMGREELVANQRAQGARLLEGSPELTWAKRLFDRATDACVEAYEDTTYPPHEDPPHPVEGGALTDAICEHVPHLERTDRDLLAYAIRTAGKRSPERKARWAHVMGLLAVGSTVAHHLCLAAGCDPEEMAGGGR